MSIAASAVERFWPKVNRDGPIPQHVPDLGQCWVWTAATSPFGYGEFKMDHQPRKAHRIAYELAHGAIPDGLLVLHRCDNPPCVRDEHLFLGTYADNSHDMAVKGRQRGGRAAAMRK